MEYDWLKEELQMFKIGVRPTDWNEWQEMCLQNGIQDGFFEEPTMTINRRKKHEVLDLKTSEGRKIKENEIFIGCVPNYRIGRNFTRNTWIAATSATCHVTNDDSGMYEVTEKKEKVQLGDGRVIYATKVGKLEVAVGKKTVKLENVRFIRDFPVKLFSIPIVLKNGAKIYGADRKLTVSKRVSGGAGIDLTFKARDNEAKSGFVFGIELEPTVRENENFQIYKHRSNQNVENNTRVKASTESYAENKKETKISDEAVVDKEVNKMMKQNEKTTDSNDSFLQPEGLMDEESNDAVVSNGETVLNTDNDEQTDEPEQKSNDSDFDEMTLQNDETMVLEADFCRDGIVDDDESIDAKTTSENDGLTTENDAGSDEDDTKGIEEEFEEENELTTETITILSESTDRKPEIETAKSLTEKQKKIDEKSMERAMVIAQQQSLFFDEEILSMESTYITRDWSTETIATESMQHGFYTMNDLKTRVKVRWKFECLLVSELTKSMRSGYYWKLLFLFRIWLMWKSVYWKYRKCIETCNRKGVRQSGVLSVCYSL